MILDDLAAATQERVAKQLRQKSLATVRAEAEALARAQSGEGGRGAAGAVCPTFKRQLARAGLNFICEVKKASPSKGLIAQNFPYLEIARTYEAAGAASISCLTEPKYFLGSDEYLQKIAQEVNLPVLRKDFTLGEYQIYQAKTLGAAAVLLICALLDETQLSELRECAESIGMDALIEAHDEAETENALQAGAKIVGVNNRNLKDFTVDTGNSIRLRKLVPPEIIFVSESGIKTADDTARLARAGVNAVLIGETLMRAQSVAKALEELKSKL